MTNPHNDVKIWVIDGMLVTNRPEVFESNFELPKSASVDGLTRVSHRPGEIRKSKPRDRQEAIAAWLADGREAT